MKALTTWKLPTKWQCVTTEVTDFAAMLPIEPCKHVVVKDTDASSPSNTYTGIIAAIESQKGQKRYKSAKLQENFSGSHQELKVKDTLHKRLGNTAINSEWEDENEI